MPWLRFRFRSKQKVYAFVDDDGAPVVDNGRVRIRYKLEDPREYSASPHNLQPIPDAEISHDDVPPAVDPGPTKGKSKGKSKSKGKGKSSGDVDGPIRVVESPPSIPESPPDGVVLIFTDGACTGNPGPAGLGVVLMFGPHRKEIWEYLGQGTNNIAELTAILRGLQSVNDVTRPVHVYTDSSYSIGVLARGWKAKANKELIEELRTLAATFTDLTLYKVKGHAGHALNEHVDYLARRAISEQGSGEQRSSEPLAAERDEGKPAFASAPLQQAPTPAATAPARPTAARDDARVKVVERPERIPERPPEGVILAFTDGACFGNPGPAGLGAVIAQGETVRELSEYLGQGTNNIAELTAILRTLEAIEDRERALHLYTDSTYAIGVLARGWKAKANKELIEQIRSELSAFSDVTLHKVKGHAGHALNERVDQLAKRAIENRQA